jgi:hypothetical protein
VSVRAGIVAVLVAQSLLDFEQDFLAFRSRLPIPEHHKSLAANAAAGFGIVFSGSAKDLHFYPPKLLYFSYLEGDHIPISKG